MTHWLAKIITLFEADTADLRELARLAGGNPEIFYRGIKLDELDIEGQNLEGMEFLPPEKPATGDQKAFDLGPHEQNLIPSHMAQKIKGARRQEERAAMLLAEFLRDRSRGMQIIDSYARDKANLTHSVLSVLRKIREEELAGKPRTNLYIARSVSGRFARTIEKRGILTYYFAKHLSSYPEIKAWLKYKSVIGLPKDKQKEFDLLVSGP